MDTATEISNGEWREFIDRTPGASIFQSPDMARVFSLTKGYRPRMVASLKGGSIRGLLASVIVSYHGGLLASLASRAIATGGPVGDQATFSALLEAHDKLVSRTALLTQVRNLSTPIDLTPFSLLGYRWEDHLNYVIDLSAGEDAVWRRMSKARRKGIGLAEKTGLAMRRLDEKDVDSAYRLLQVTYRRAGIPLADKSLFRAALDVLGPRDCIFGRVAVLDSGLCAVRFVLRWNDSLYDWYAGSSDLGREVHADEWLVWSILREGIAEACTTFDFGGAGRSGEVYGPGEFKRRFGGLEVNPGRFCKVYRPIASRLTDVAARVWGRLH